MEKIIFYTLALTMIVSAIASVTSRKMLRSVVYLLFVLIATAGVYFMADYNFLAGIQLTVYAGGIIVLIIFSVLLVHHIEMELEVAKKSKRIMTAIVCLLGLGVFLNVLYSYPFAPVPNTVTTSVSDIGLKLLSYGDGGFILPFEVISILLLAAIIGAITIAKGGKIIIPDNQDTEAIKPVETEKPVERQVLIIEEEATIVSEEETELLEPIH